MASNPAMERLACFSYILVAAFDLFNTNHFGRLAWGIFLQSVLLTSCVTSKHVGGHHYCSSQPHSASSPVPRTQLVVVSLWSGDPSNFLDNRRDFSSLLDKVRGMLSEVALEVLRMCRCHLVEWDDKWPPPVAFKQTFPGHCDVVNVSPWWFLKPAGCPSPIAAHYNLSWMDTILVLETIFRANLVMTACFS